MPASASPALPRVVFWDNLPAPYAVERYNLLADRRTVDLHVWFLRRTDPDRQWPVDETTWRFRGAFIDDPSSSLASMKRFVDRVDHLRPDVVVSLYGEWPFVVGHAVLKAMGVRIALVVERTFDAWIRRTWWKELAKALLFHSADAAQVHTPPPSTRDLAAPDGFRYAWRYGFARQHVFGVTHSIDVSHGSAPVDPDALAKVRALKDRKTCLFLYVGRYWHGKGWRVLLDAFRLARRANPGVALLLIGNGPDEEEVRSAARGLDAVTVWPFVPRHALRAAYAAADVFVFPTLGDPFGLVIEEAHAAGLPVITSDAAGDVRQRVVEGVTGYVVPAGDAAGLTDRMLRLARDAALRAEMGARGASRVRYWSHETWADDFERCVAGSLMLPRRTTPAATITTTIGQALVTAADLAARTRVFLRKASSGGLRRTVLATVHARLNRAGMRLVSLSWRLSRPRHVLKRYGTALGGWVLPEDSLTPPGVCYCIGVGEDTSLEDALLRRTACTVWSFDPTPRSIVHVEKQPFDRRRFTFVPIGIWDRIDTVRFFQHSNPAFETHSPVNIWQTDRYFDAPCSTVADVMRQHGHDELLLLKIDTEGGEWRVLENVLRDAPKVRILCVLFCQPAAFWRVAAMVRRLRRHGYRYLAHDQWKFTFHACEPGVA